MKQCVAGAYVEKSVLFWPDLIVESTALRIHWPEWSGIHNTFPQNKKVAGRGGKVAGNARKETEKELGRSVISKQNLLNKEDKLALED